MSAGSLDEVANAVSRRSWSRVVAFVLVFVMVASALAIVPTPARASSRPRIGLPEAMPDYMKFIVVNSFRFDPLAAMPTMPTSLQYNSLPRNQPLYYLAQFNGPVTPLMKAQLTATGATILYYIPYNTFIVRADGLTMDRSSVSRISLEITAFEPSRLSEILRVVSYLGGVQPIFSFGQSGSVRVELDKSTLPLLARTPGVMYVDRFVQPTVSNDIARWVIQSGDTVNFATPVHDHGIYGTGQLRTLGDTGLDFGHPDFADPNHTTPGPDHRKVKDYYSPPCPPGGCNGHDDGINHG